ncbi:hypothetical protein RDABS01_008009, partial [Bienertia sinuspersici]
PVSGGSFHRHVAASLLRNHLSVNRNGHEIQTGSPASYSSSMEFKGRIGDPSQNLKTSTELIKVLNRIWCLEEQHTSNVSLLKALKSDLDNARTRIRDLLREKQKDRQVIDDLMKQISEHKHVKRNMEQERVQSSLQSVRQNERKLRKRSEKRKKSTILLEELCDEFAMGIRHYEQELRSQNTGVKRSRFAENMLIAWFSIFQRLSWMNECRSSKSTEDFDIHNKSYKGSGFRH